MQATRITGCSASQIRYWDRIGLIRPAASEGSARRYGFRELVALRMVRSLLDAGLPLQRIRRAVEFLQREPATADWTGLRLVSDGTTVFACHDDGQVLDALANGQLALFVSVDGLVREVQAEVRQFSTERDAFLDALHPETGETAP